LVGVVVGDVFFWRDWGREVGTCFVNFDGTVPEG
jgi:hypothetical protein